MPRHSKTSFNRKICLQHSSSRDQNGACQTEKSRRQILKCTEDSCVGQQRKVPSDCLEETQVQACKRSEFVKWVTGWSWRSLEGQQQRQRCEGEVAIRRVAGTCTWREFQASMIWQQKFTRTASFFLCIKFGQDNCSYKDTWFS